MSNVLKSGYIRYPYENVPCELNRFFLGKFLSAEDFECEQNYFRERSRLRNAALAGPGIVAGLEVSRNLEASNCFEVSAGLAFDHLGRELLLNQNVSVHVDSQLAGFLVLHYDEAAIEPVPVLAREEGSRDRDIVMNHIREAPVIEFICTDDQATAQRSGVVLARLLFEKKEPQTRHLSQTMRSYAARDPMQWPVILNINWTHGGLVPRALLESNASGDKPELRLVMDLNMPVSAFGLSSQDEQDLKGLVRLFVGDGNDPLAAFLPGVRLDDKATSISCSIPAAILARGGQQRVSLSLLTENLMDALGRVVDGCLLKGVTPTGNGVPGSTFESWFTLDLGR